MKRSAISYLQLLCAAAQLIIDLPFSAATLWRKGEERKFSSPG